jgi:hypothetical protein
MIARIRTKPAATALALALLFGAATTACGSDGGDDAKDTTTTTTAGDKGSGTTGTTKGDGGSTSTPATDPEPDVPKVSGAEQAYVDALVATYDAEEDQPYSKTQVSCLAARWVPIIGVGTFQDKGITPEDLADSSSNVDDLKLPEDKARKMVKAMETCGVNLVETMLTGMTEGATPEQKACITDAIDAKDIEEFMVKSFMGDEDANSDPFEAVGKCFNPGLDESSSSTPN